MAGVLEQLVVLCNQLVVIGYDQPNVLIAGMIIVAAIAITIVAVCAGLILSVPVLIIWSIGKGIAWLWRVKHPSTFVEFDEEEEYNYIPAQHRSSTQQRQHRPPSTAPNDLPPVYPDWMNQKSGRLL